MGVQTNARKPGQTVKAGSPYFAEFIEPTRNTPRQEIDELLNELQANKDEWVRLEIAERLSIVDEIREDLSTLNERWIQAELQAKGLPPKSFGEAEEWTILATIHRALRSLRRSLVEIQEQG